MRPNFKVKPLFKVTTGSAHRKKKTLQDYLRNGLIEIKIKKEFSHLLSQSRGGSFIEKGSVVGGIKKNNKNLLLK